MFNTSTIKSLCNKQLFNIQSAVTYIDGDGNISKIFVKQFAYPEFVDNLFVMENIM